MEADAALVRAARLVVLHAVALEPGRLTGDELVDVAVLQADVAAADRHVRPEQRAPVEDDLAVRELLEPLRVAHLRHRQVRELAGLLGATGTSRSFSFAVT